MMNKYKEIPSFLSEFLRFRNSDKSLLRVDSTNHFFFFENYGGKDLPCFFFKETCRLMLDVLSAKFNSTEEDLGWPNTHTFKNINEFFKIKLIENENFMTTLAFDAPVYWYDDSNKKLGKLTLPGGYTARFVNFPNTSVSVYYNFNWFSKNIIRSWPYVDYNDEIIYFEPAAKLNRGLLREFSKAVKQKFPEISVVFSAYKTGIKPYDDFGFLDGASIQQI